MANNTRGTKPVRTMSGLVDQRRVRTPAGALLELSAMANEKQLLNRELARWRKRRAEIEARLAEIAVKERRLMALATGPAAHGAESPSATDMAHGLEQKIKVKEFLY